MGYYYTRQALGKQGTFLAALGFLGLCGAVALVYWPAGAILFCVGFVAGGVQTIGKLTMTKDGKRPVDSPDE